MIFVDSTALVKLVHVEAETPALVNWLDARSGEVRVASALVEIEVPRALRRSHPGAVDAVAGVLAKINRVEISKAIRTRAGGYTDPLLRSLDAVHLATAEALNEGGRVSAFVTYDQRLAAASRGAGLNVLSPGVE